MTDAVPDVPPTGHRAWRLRVGRKVGRTIYEQKGDEPSDGDVLIGVMDTPEWARLAVDAVNGVSDVQPDVRSEAASPNKPGADVRADVPPDPPAADREALARVLLNAPPHPQWSPTADLASMIADALLSSGVLVDAADVRARVERSWRREIERALREADWPEDSMATDEDIARYEGRHEAVEIVREMLQIDAERERTT